MKKTQLLPLVALATLTIAHAQETKAPWYQEGGFYATLGTGVAFFNEGSVNVLQNDSGAASFDIDASASLSLRLGHEFGPLRIEGEMHYIDATVSELDSDTGPIIVDSGLTTFGFMANAIWDFDLKPFTVSVGAGMGFNRTEYDAMIDRGNVLVSDSSSTVFANQIMLSASYPINDHASVGLSYRYIMLQGFDDRGKVDTNTLDTSDIDFDNLDGSVIEAFITWQF